jgi:DNA-directed RNA polymerase subunit RPC12/RpoP
MPEPASRFRVPCTFPGCGRIFGSDAEMKKHKIADPEHEYCSRCDEDFQDEERLLIHKIKSNKHIVCPICGSEYRSESGRDHHILQVCS